jgi:hypothetical protein
VSTLVGLRYNQSFEPDNLEQYGLDDAAYDISFTAADESYRLRIGNKNPTGTQYYALLGDDDSMVYLLSSASSTDTVLNIIKDLPFVEEPTPTPIPVLVEGPIFSEFDIQAVTKLTITDAETDEELVLERDEGTFLWLIPDSPSTVDQTRVNVALSQFGALQAVDVVPADNLEALGLEEPQNLIIAQLGSEDDNHFIAVGDHDPTGTRYYVRVNAYENEVAVVEADWVDFVLELLSEPPILPEATPEVTAEVTEATAEIATEEATEAVED